jgi:hypothetical protein
MTNRKRLVVCLRICFSWAPASPEVFSGMELLQTVAGCGYNGLALESAALIGAWRSLVAHSAGGRVVGGSNPLAPILLSKILLSKNISTPLCSQIENQIVLLAEVSTAGNCRAMLVFVA